MSIVGAVVLAGHFAAVGSPETAPVFPPGGEPGTVLVIMHKLLFAFFQSGTAI